jgi:hypothetical protein
MFFVSPFSGSVGRRPRQGGHGVGSYPTFMTKSGGLGPHNVRTCTPNLAMSVG